MNLHHNLQRNTKGIGTIFGMVFFILIVMVVFASFVIILSQNTGLEQTTAQAKQLDLDRYTELETVSVANPEAAVLNNVVYIECSLTNNGTLPTQFVRLWIKDITQNTTGETLISPSITLLPSATPTYYFNQAYVTNAGPSDQFSFWFITTRGNRISAYPAINHFNGITSNGTFPGVNSINSTYATNNTPLQLSLTTTQPNQLIYVVVSYDDGNTLYTPTSTPNLNWTLRGQSQSTSQTGGWNGGGDSILETFYTIDPSVGPVTISIHSTADELSDYYCSALEFAITGVNTTSPFDGSAQTTIGQSIMSQDTITTHYSNEFIIGALGIDDLNPAITPGPGFAQIMPVQSSYGASGQDNAMPRSVWSEWAIAQVPTTNLSVNCTFSITENWATILDAVNLVITPPTSPITLSSTSGPCGQTISVSGQGFAPNSPLLATFGGSQIPFSFTTDASGNIPPGATITVPQRSPISNNTVTIIDSKFNYASTNFTVTPTTITVSPQSGPLGTAVTVRGSNFVPNSNITINFDGNLKTTNPSTITANTTGGFSATFNTISDTVGVKQISATDGFNYPTANFTVIPLITLNPTNGPISSSVNVTGYGFAPSTPITITFAGSIVNTIPASPTTDNNGFFNATFNIPTGQTAGGKTVGTTDSLLNAANAIFTVTPSIFLNPTNGSAGSAVTVSGSGFAANSALTATYVGTSITLSGATLTNSTGSFLGATFTVPTSTAGGAQTVVIKDAGSNSASTIFTVNTLYQKITVALNNLAPTATVTVNGGYPSPNSFAADGTPYNIMMIAGSSFTLSFSNSGNTRDGFNVANVFSSTSSPCTASTNSISLTGYEQVQNTFGVSFPNGNPNSGDSLPLAGTYLAASSTIGTLNSTNSWSTSAWVDYGTTVTFPASTALSGSSERWAMGTSYSTVSLTAGGNPYSQTYYNQYSFQLDYAVSGGGSPTASTLTAKQFGSSYTPTLGTSLASYWLDNGQSWSVTNPLGGSGTNERWASRQTISGAVSSSSPTTAGTGTLTFTYNHQYLLTVIGGNGVTYGTASPSGDNWYDNGMSTTVSSNGIYSRASGTGQRVSFWQIDSGTTNNVATTGTVTTSSVTMSATHIVTFAPVTQYLLTVTGGNGVAYGTSSAIAGDTGWYDVGMSTTVSSSWVWGTSGGTRSAVSNWQLDGTNKNPARQNTGTLVASSVSMSAAHTINLISTTQYYLTVTSGNGVSYGTASPTSDNWYDNGMSTTVSSNWVWNIVSGQSRTAVSNYAVDGSNSNPTRSNTGTLTTSVSMTTFHTVSFSTVTQYYLTVTGGNGITYGTASPTSDYWYDSGGSTTVSSNGIYTRSSGTGIRVSSWKLDSGSNNNVATSGTVTTSAVSMSTYHTVVFNSISQYQVALDSGATSALNTITNPTISGDSGWYDSGTSVTLTLNGIYGRSGGSGTRISGYAINGGSNNPESTTGTFTVLNAISISAPQTITTTKVTQYQVTLDATATSALNSITIPTISSDNYWYDSGTTVNVVLNGVWGQSGGTGTRLSGYVLNGGSNNPVSTTGTVTVFSGAISNHEFVTSTSVTQYQVTFSQTGIGSSASSNTILTVGSATYAYSNFPVNGIWVDTGTTFTWSPTVSGSVGTQFVKTGSSGSSPITVAGTYSATYQTQYYLTVTSANGSPTGQGWYNSGVSAPFSVTTPASGGTGIQYILTSWSGSGTGAYSGINSSSSVTMNNPITETANWQTQYYLTLNSAYGTITGAGWYNSGATAYAGVNSGTVSGGTGTQYVFTSWSGGASGTNYAQSSAITMSGPVTVTANWQTQYQVTFAVTPSGSGSTSPTGTSWQNAGAVVPITASKSGSYNFNKWTTTGSITIANPTQGQGTHGSSTSATINGSGTITANFQ